MAGNVSEWTRSRFQDYPYDAQDGREDLQDVTQTRVNRGGSFGYVDDFIQTTSRSGTAPDEEDITLGFRLVLNAR